MRIILAGVPKHAGVSHNDLFCDFTTQLSQFKIQRAYGLGYTTSSLK
jgi:hypothetical protein